MITQALGANGLQAKNGVSILAEGLDCKTPRTQGLCCTVGKRRNNSECPRTSLVFLYSFITENRQVKAGRDEGLGHLVTMQPQKCWLRLRKVSNGYWKREMVGRSRDLRLGCSNGH